MNRKLNNLAEKKTKQPRNNIHSENQKELNKWMYHVFQLLTIVVETCVLGVFLEMRDQIVFYE